MSVGRIRTSDMPPPTKGEAWMLKEIRHRLKINRNVIIMVVGPPGSGKSYASLRLSELLHEDPHLFFHVDDFVEYSKDIQPFDVVVWDDVGSGGGGSMDWNTIEGKATTIFLESWRFKRTVLIASVPSMFMASKSFRRLSYFVLWMLPYMDYEKNISRATIYRWFSNPLTDKDRAFHPFAHVGDGSKRLRSISFHHPTKIFVDRYEKLKGIAVDIRWKIGRERVRKKREKHGATPVR